MLYGFLWVHAVYQHVVYAVLYGLLIYAKAAGAVALRVDIHAQHPLALLGNACRKVDGGGGFAYPAFLVSYGDYFSHVSSFFA